MAASFNLRTLFFAILLTSACSAESGDPQTPEDDEEQEQEDEDDDDDNSSAEASKDAGQKDAGKDAGKQDTGAEDDDDQSADDDDGSDDDSPADAGARDAGRMDGGGTDAGRASDAKTADTGGGAASCDELTYETFGQEFLMNYCVGCHGEALQMEMVRLDSLDDVVTNKTKVKAEAVTATKMPPMTAAKKPTAAEREKLGQWLDCGPN